VMGRAQDRGGRSRRDSAARSTLYNAPARQKITALFGSRMRCMLVRQQQDACHRRHPIYHHRPRGAGRA
jgi:hypothetical protein